MYPFVFTDIMGLEKETNQGVGVQDLKLAMKGHIKDGYNVQLLNTLNLVHYLSIILYSYMIYFEYTHKSTHKIFKRKSYY